MDPRDIARLITEDPNVPADNQEKLKIQPTIVGVSIQGYTQPWHEDRGNPVNITCVKAEADEMIMMIDNRLYRTECRNGIPACGRRDYTQDQLQDCLLVSAALEQILYVVLNDDPSREDAWIYSGYLHHYRIAGGQVYAADD